MTRRRVLLFGSVAVVVALAVALWVVWPRPSAINRENAAKIKEGMSLTEVEAILGGPPRNESTGPTETAPLEEWANLGALFRSRPVTREWESDSVRISVFGDNNGKVHHFDWTPLRRQPQGALDMLRRCLNL